jgi:long-chain acyl-CoA synthetase
MFRKQSTNSLLLFSLSTIYHAPGDNVTDRTLPGLFVSSVQKYPDNVLLWENADGEYSGTTYKETYEAVLRLTAGLQALGLAPGDRAALIAEGRKEWVIAELAILMAGAVNVPISVKIDEANDLKYRLLHAGCTIVILSGSERAKLLEIANDLPDLRTCILLDAVDDPTEIEISFPDTMKKGAAYLSANRETVTERWQSVREHDYANICYTSGTTADPKGILLTHRNYTANVEQSSALVSIPEWYVSLLILPLDHAFAHTVGIYTLMKNGASMAFVQSGKSPLETLRNIPRNIMQIRPTFLLSVPALAKSFRKNIENGIREKGPLAERLFNHALNIAYTYNGHGFDAGKGLQKLRYPLCLLFDKILFSKIRQSFGGRLAFFIGGGALLDIELQRFFYAIGIPMYQGYGLTEASPVISSNIPASHKLGSSGKIVRELEIKICDEKGAELPAESHGEIVIRGENVMAGYWKNQKATEETIRDGWLYTGDLGYLDADGFLYVLGRSKSLLIANDGEKYSPEGIEEALTENSAYIEQVMLFNNQSPATVALVYPNKQQLLHYLQNLHLDFSTETGQRAALLKIESEIAAYRDGGKFQGSFPVRWLPTAVAILGDGFTEQNHFLNSTLKMVRGKITTFYQSRIDYLFTAEGRDICNEQNMHIVSRF